MNELSMISLILVAVAAATAGLLARGLFSGYPAAALPRALLGAREQAVISACADAFFPPLGPIPLSGTEAGLIPYMDAYVRRTPPATRALIRMLFVFLELQSFVFGPRRARFTRLLPAERIDALSTMSTSGIYFRRVAFLSMRTMLTMGYLANPSVARAIGSESRLAPFDEGPSPESGRRSGVAA